MPSIDRDRRGLLAALGSAVALAGCQTDDEQSSTDSPPGTESETATPTSSPAPSGRFSLTPVDPADADGELTVFPENLREWLRTVATTDETVRAHAGTYSVDPDPPLPAFERVQVLDELGDIEGIYDLAVEGDTRYRLLVGAEPTDPPDDADVTPVESLSAARRRLTLAAIEGAAGDDARVYPETALGSWVRQELFGGFVSSDGETYRGFERQQTDAEFYATNVWYVLSGTAVDAPSAPATLRLAAIDDRVRDVVEELQAATNRPQSTETAVTGETAAAVRAFVERVPFLLTHDAVYRTDYEP
jgi:hypothetical protein